MDPLFPGEAARPVPPWSGGRWTIAFGPDEPPPPPPVTHAEGYGPFVELVRRAGEDPAALAADLPAFAAFVVAHGDALRDEALAEAAGVFLGNALVVLRPGTTWQSSERPSVGSGAMSVEVGRFVPALLDAPERIDLRALLAQWDAQDARWGAVDAAMEATRLATEAVVPPERPGFEPPSTAVPTALDEAGSPIPYGERWRDLDAGPPEDAYERVTHPERFAPLHDLADALVAYLVQHHDVEALEAVDADGDRVVTLRPAAGAPLRITWTAFPGLRLRAGLLATEDAPACGCDACDETAASQAESVVDFALAVADGRFTERLPTPPGAAAFTIGGSGSGGVDLPDEDERLVDPAEVAALAGAPWPAWPIRTA